MIVEDDRTNRTLLGIQARDAALDYGIVAAEDGQQALDRLNEAAPIALILLDLGMPEVDGFEFLRRLRARPEHLDTPVIVVTARDLSRGERSSLREMGVRSLLQKGGYSTTTLIDAICEVVR